MLFSNNLTLKSSLHYAVAKFCNRPIIIRLLVIFFLFSVCHSVMTLAFKASPQTEVSFVLMNNYIYSWQQSQMLVGRCRSAISAMPGATLAPRANKLLGAPLSVNLKRPEPESSLFALPHLLTTPACFLPADTPPSTGA